MIRRPKKLLARIIRALLLLLIASCHETLKPQAQRSEELTASNEVGTLHGTLLLPSGRPPFPVVLIVAGSGPVDRDGNWVPALHTDAYRLLAEGLASKGVASLRYDKRGVGASAAAVGRVEEMRIEMEADDVNRFMAVLRRDARLGRLVLAGHSLGSLLSILAAEAASADAYASLEGAGRPIGTVLREQLARQIIDANLLAQANAIIDQLEAGRTVASVPDVLAALFAPSVQPYLISWMKYDPPRELAKLSGPALIVQGTTDVQVGVADAQLLAAARPDATLAIVQGMCHVLKLAGSSPDSQRSAYTDPSLPLVPEIVERLAALARP